MGVLNSSKGQQLLAYDTESFFLTELGTRFTNEAMALFLAW